MSTSNPNMNQDRKQNEQTRHQDKAGQRQQDQGENKNFDQTKHQQQGGGSSQDKEQQGGQRRM